MNWLRLHGAGFRLALHVQPGAKRSEIVGPHGERLKIRIAAPPLEGRANEALLAFIAARLDLPRSKVRVIQGESSREKTVEVLDANARPERLLP